MRKRIIFFIFSIIVLINFVHTISSYSACNISNSCNPDNTVLKLSSLTNAHGELWNQTNYGKYLCCNFTGTHNCVGGIVSSNKILGLSSLTNAHAQVPFLTSYPTDVCYGNLECKNATSCDSDEGCLITISSNTNAHLATCSDYYAPLISIGAYPMKICCKGLGAIGNCTLDFAETYWGENDDESKIEYDVTAGTPVKMISKGDDRCNGQTFTFKIYEQDCVPGGACDYNDTGIFMSATFSNGKVVVPWVTEWIPDSGGTDADPEYVFKVFSGSTEKAISNELKVLKEPDAYWTNDKGKIIFYKDIIPEETKVGMVAKNTGLAVGSVANFEIYKDGIWSDRGIRVEDNAINGYVNGSGVAIANWTMSYDDWDEIDREELNKFYFKVGEKRSYNLIATILPPGYCLRILSCGNYETESRCGNDPCEIGVRWIEQYIEVDCDDSNLNCRCAWNGTTCNALYNVARKNCSNGIVEYGEQCDDGNLNNNDGCNSTCSYEIDRDIPCNWGTLCSDGTCSLNCYFTDNGPATCNSNGTCDSNESCSCADCNGKQDSCATGRVCSLQDKACCKPSDTADDGICDRYCSHTDPDCETIYSQFDDDKTIGTCTLHENTNDNCEDGSLTYAWEPSLNWPTNNPGLTTNPDGEDYVLFSQTIESNWDNKWHYDPIGENNKRPLFDNCREGENTVPCPSQVQLSFFSSYSLIIAIVLIVLIYLFIMKKDIE